MTGPSSPNRFILIEVAKQLRPLLPDIVFVGGQVAELLVTDPAATRIRATDDVDVVVGTTTRLQYFKLGERLTQLGLKHDTSEDAPMCRWLTTGGFKVDVMPQDKDVLGFSNRWYSIALERSVEYTLEVDLAIRIPTAPVFLATKWDAFVNPQRKHSGDYLASHDFEDIVTVIAGRSELIGEIRAESDELRNWLSGRAAAFLEHESAPAALYGALPDASSIPELLSDVRSRFEALARAAVG